MQEQIILNPSVLWEILIPTVNPRTKRPIRTRYHRVFDSQIRKISEGLTILPPSKGQWISSNQEMLQERMIPVRFTATRAEAEKIIDFALKYYEQNCIMCYRISDLVIMKYAKEQPPKHL